MKHTPQLGKVEILPPLRYNTLMTTLTLEIPDDLAEQIRLVKHRLPELLSKALSSTEMPLTVPAPRQPHPAFDEMLDFLASGPTSEKLLVFKVSPKTQKRLETLLDKNKEESLSKEENDELDVFQQVNHIFILLKARTRQQMRL